MATAPRVIISKRLVAVNSVSSVLARVVNFVVLLWVYQYLLRHLSAAEFAILPLVTSLMVFGPLFFSFFIGGIARYMVDAYAKDDIEGMRRVTSSLFPVLLGAAAVLLPAGLYFATHIDSVFNVAPGMVEQTRLMFTLLLLSFTFQTVIIPFTSAYAVSQRYYEKNLIDVARDLLRAGLTVALLVILGPSVFWVVVATVLAETCASLLMLARSFRIVPELGFEWRLFSFRLAREMTSFGFWTTLDRLGAILHTHAATLVLNLTGTPAEVTAYYIGATFFRQIESTIKLAAMPLLPVVTAMNALGDMDRLGAAVLRGGRYALWAALIVAVPLAIYADIFVMLYTGPDYGITAWVIVLFQILGFVLMLVFAQGLDLGAIGVTLALVAVTIGSQLAYFWGLCLRLTGRSFGEFAATTLLRGMLPAAVGAIAWTALRLAMPPETWGALITQGVIGACVYVLALLGLCLDLGEKRDLHHVIGRIRQWKPTA
jgi:O-antigen/teichoic acid export membrane protein